MSAEEDAKLPELPKEFPHIFTEVIFQLMPEVDYNDLVYLSQLLKINEREEIYKSLIDALRKMQWTKLSGMEAITMEKDIVEQMKEGVLVFNPVGQVKHAKAVFELIVHTKAALDSIAVFLTELLSIPAKGGQRDLKHKNFREQIIQKDAVIGQGIKSLERWFRDVQDRRDKWIHRTSTGIFVTSEPSEIGVLPISKVVTEDFELQDFPLTKEYYWTTQQFIELHLTKLAFFFNLIVSRCIQIELASIEAPPPYPPKSGQPITAFPLRVIKNMTLKEIRLRF